MAEMQPVKVSFPDGTTKPLTELVDAAILRTNEIGESVSLFGQHTLWCLALDYEAGTDCQTCTYSDAYNGGRCKLGIVQDSEYQISLRLEKEARYCEKYKPQDLECTCK